MKRFLLTTAAALSLSAGAAFAADQHVPYDLDAVPVATHGPVGVAFATVASNPNGMPGAVHAPYDLDVVPPRPAQAPITVTFATVPTPSDVVTNGFDNAQIPSRPMEGHGVIKAANSQPSGALETFMRPTGVWVSEDHVVHGIKPIGATDAAAKEHRWQIMYSARRAELPNALPDNTPVRVITANTLPEAIQKGIIDIQGRGWIDGQMVAVHVLN